MLLTAVHRAGFEKGAAYAKLDSLLVVAAKKQLASKSKAARRELRIVTARYNQTQGLKSFSWDLKEMCPTIWEAVRAVMTTKQLESRANKEFTPQRGATAKDGQIEGLLRTTVHRAPAFELDAWLDHADNTTLFTVAVTDALDAKIDVVQQEFAKLVAFHVVMCDDEGRDDLLKAYAKFGVEVGNRVAKELFPGTPEKPKKRVELPPQPKKRAEKPPLTPVKKKVVFEGHAGGGAAPPQVVNSPPITPPAPPKPEPSAGLSWKGWGMLLTAGLGLYAYTSVNSYLTGDDGEGHLVVLDEL